MKPVYEEDVVLAFRQSVEEQLKQMQEGKISVEEIFAADVSLEESVHRIAKRQQQLEQEIALLRTIILRLISEPLDGES